jgi:hypothetical protein
MFSATADDSLLCTVRYEDPTGIQGCQFDVGQNSTTKVGFADASAYKGTGTKFRFVKCSAWVRLRPSSIRLRAVS